MNKILLSILNVHVCCPDILKFWITEDVVFDSSRSYTTQKSTYPPVRGRGVVVVVTSYFWYWWLAGGSLWKYDICKVFTWWLVFFCSVWEKSTMQPKFDPTVVWNHHLLIKNSRAYISCPWDAVILNTLSSAISKKTDCSTLSSSYYANSTRTLIFISI